MNVQIGDAAVRMTKGGRTKMALLGAAEREFAEFGFDAVSVRQVADSAGQNVGVLTYHFPTKEELFEAVVARRADELTERRRAVVDSLVDPTLEDLLDAFLGPFRERIENGEPGWRSYARILAHIAQESRWAPLVDEFFGEAGRRFIRLLRQVEPKLSLDTATHGYVHLIAIMVGLFASTGLIDRLSSGRMSSEDLASNYDFAMRFLAGGFRALSSEN